VSDYRLVRAALNRPAIGISATRILVDSVVRPAGLLRGVTSEYRSRTAPIGWEWGGRPWLLASQIWCATGVRPYERRRRRWCAAVGLLAQALSHKLEIIHGACPIPWGSNIFDLENRVQIFVGRASI